MVKRLAFAKINLFLDIEGLRSDGYHNIASVMQTVDWADEISVEKTERKGIFLTCSDPTIPTDRKNTVYKAAELFLERVAFPGGVELHIEKSIPSAAGLAGGSADAAAALLCMNRLLCDPLSLEELLGLGAKIGADVPFCMVGGTKRTTGIGDVLEPFPALPSCFVVCGKLGDGVSTPEAYRALDEKHDRFIGYRWNQERENILRHALENAAPEALGNGMYNLFESVIEPKRPAVSSMKAVLISHGAVAAMMSGSGPSVFGIFLREAEARHACAALRQMGAECRVCRPCETAEGEVLS